MTEQEPVAGDASIFVETAEVLDNARLAGGQHCLRLHAPRVAAQARAGQFVHMRCAPELLMRRPMSIMRTDRERGIIEILFKRHGRGTQLLSASQSGDQLSVMGPIGRAFKQDGYRGTALLIGGGVGIPPIIFLAEHLRAQGRSCLVLMGSEDPFPFTLVPSRILVAGMPEGTIATMPLLEDLGIAARLASLRDVAGCYRGYVTELAAQCLEHDDSADTEVEMFACGPPPMLKAVAALAARYALACEISLEEYMACAVGGCAGCAVPIQTASGRAMQRVCVDGPVFDAHAVVF